MPLGKVSVRFLTVLVLITLMIGNPTGTYAEPAAPGAAFPALAAAGGAGSKFGLVTHIATRFGIYGQQNGPMDVATGSGAGWIREELRWDWVEHPLGNWDWGFTDEMVQDARGRGLEILGLLGYNNSAQTAGTVNFTVPDIGLWKNYVAQVVGRYKGQIRVWEVWNEPDVPYFWNGSVAEYVTLLRETYTTIKAVDPTATVLNGAASSLDMNWFNDFLTQGGAQYVDALAFHPYAMRSSLDNGDYAKIDLPRFRDIQQRTGKPWWFTELGWSSASAGADYGGGVGSEQAQANYMVRQFVQSLNFPGLDVQRIFWYNFRDDGTDPNNPENNFGLIKNDWRTPKFSYTAYQQLVAHLTGATPQGTIDSGAGLAYRFNRNGTIVDVVWGGGRTSLPTTASSVTAFDMAGNPIPAEVSGGQIRVTVGSDPVYIEHAGAAQGIAPPAPQTGAPNPAVPVSNPPKALAQPPFAPRPTVPQPAIAGKK